MALLYLPLLPPINFFVPLKCPKLAAFPPEKNELKMDVACPIKIHLSSNVNFLSLFLYSNLRRSAPFTFYTMGKWDKKAAFS
jgi:hypothetical protein